MPPPFKYAYAMYNRAQQLRQYANPITRIGDAYGFLESMTSAMPSKL
jgi:hypothetical protein